MKDKEIIQEKHLHIEPNDKVFNLKLKELLQYRYLVYLFTKRNYSTRYKQTILGPLWLIISPLFTVFTYTLIFGGIAGLSTDGIPQPLFYLSGYILWTFFSSNVSSNASTFTGNAGIFGKIYFPRLVIPISTSITLLLDFFVQFLLLMGLSLFYVFNGYEINWNHGMLLLPFLLLELFMLGMGIGIIISSMTTKYRDLSVLVGFGLHIWMYLSPVIYSTVLVPDRFMNLFMLNPVTPCLLIFKFAYFGIGDIPWNYWFISWIFTLSIFFIGIIVFNNVERTFMDTV